MYNSAFMFSVSFRHDNVVYTYATMMLKESLETVTWATSATHNYCCGDKALGKILFYIRMYVHICM